MCMIDNSSALRMKQNIPLVVPHINFPSDKHIFIANPNCSTIILSCLLKPLINYRIKRVVVSTYQSASGAGKEGIDELMIQMKEMVNMKELTKTFLGKQYIGNCFVHNSELTSTYYNMEENKLIKETQKIFSNEKPFGITATCIRVPTIRSHCESVNIQFKNAITYEKIIELLSNDPNLVIMDNKNIHDFPDTLISSNNNKVYIGHIRQDFSLPKNKGWNFWIS